jgi:hypothetical protein
MNRAKNCWRWPWRRGGVKVPLQSGPEWGVVLPSTGLRSHREKEPDVNRQKGSDMISTPVHVDGLHSQQSTILGSPSPPNPKAVLNANPHDEDTHWKLATLLEAEHGVTMEVAHHWRSSFTFMGGVMGLDVRRDVLGVAQST